jgi:hypothetical protein
MTLPGRDLSKAKGWYWRALLVNFSQLGITLATARLWIRSFTFRFSIYPPGICLLRKVSSGGSSERSSFTGGFPKGAEEKLGAMLGFKDVYYEEPATVVSNGAA